MSTPANMEPDDELVRRVRSIILNFLLIRLIEGREITTNDELTQRLGCFRSYFFDS